MKNRLKKIRNYCYRQIIKPLVLVNGPAYTKKYVKFLKKNGMNIIGTPLYLSSSISFDGSDYGLITLEEGCSISKGVTILTHDFSRNTVYKGLNLENESILDTENKKNGLLDLRPVRIGSHSFIGANVFILPGTTIGNNVIIGAGSVVRGVIPDNSIVIGNPAQVIKKTSDWLIKQKF